MACIGAILSPAGHVTAQSISGCAAFARLVKERLAWQ